MKRYAVFYLSRGPYGVVPEPLEVFICQAEDSEHAVEQFEDAEPNAVLQFVMVEV